MQLLNADTVHRLLDYRSLMDALEAAHRETPPLLERALLQPPAESTHRDESFLVLPAWIPGRVMGVKMATVIPANARRPGERPTIHAAYQLFDGETGEPLASLDGTALTLRKTAADSGLGSRLLAPSAARTLLMVGAGALAPHLVAAHRAARPSIDRILVWNRTPERRDALVDELAAEGLNVEAVDHLANSIRDADVISCATATHQPLIHGHRLRPGQHLDLVGAFRADMRESDDDCVRRASVFVDLRLTTVDSAGDLAGPIADGVIARGDVRADLFELCSGTSTARVSDDEITLFKNGGGGHLDLFTAEYCYRRFREEQRAAGRRQ